MIGLTSTQREALAVFAHLEKNTKGSVSVRAVMSALNLANPSNTYRIITRLEDSGMLSVNQSGKRRVSKAGWAYLKDTKAQSCVDFRDPDNPTFVTIGQAARRALYSKERSDA